jgi:hypothetical protein
MISRKHIVIFLTGLLLSPALSGTGQDVAASARLDTTTILIGDQVGLTLSFRMPAGAQVRWPLFGDTILRNVQVINRYKIDTTPDPDKKHLTLSQKILVTSFDSGMYVIPPVLFLYRIPPDTTVLTGQTGTIMLNVNSVPVDTTQAIKPIKGPMKVPLTFREILPWIIGALVLAGLVFLVIWYIRKRKKAEPLIRLRSRIRLLPHEIALAELEKLRIRKLWQGGKIKEYHSELTGIIRRYMEDRFRIKALESTTGEIMEDLRRTGEIRDSEMERIGRILVLADFVKFAKAQPLPAENEQCLEEAIGFVKETVIITEPGDNLNTA